MTDQVEQLSLIPTSELEFLRNFLKNGSNLHDQKSAMCQTISGESFEKDKETFKNKTEKGFKTTQKQKKIKENPKKKKQLVENSPNNLIHECMETSGLFDDCNLSTCDDDLSQSQNQYKGEKIDIDYQDQNQAYNDTNHSPILEESFVDDYQINSSLNRNNNQIDNSLNNQSPIITTTTKVEKPSKIKPTIDMNALLEKVSDTISSRYKRSFNIFRDFVMSRPKIFKRLEKFDNDNLEQIISVAFSKKKNRIIKSEKRFYSILQKFGENSLYLISNETRLRNFCQNMKPWYKL